MKNEPYVTIDENYILEDIKEYLRQILSKLDRMERQVSDMSGRVYELDHRFPEE